MKTKKIITSIVIGTLILSTGTAVIDKNNVIRAKSDFPKINRQQTGDEVLRIVSPYIKINKGIITLENKLLLKTELAEQWSTIQKCTTYKSSDELYENISLRISELEKMSKENRIFINDDGTIIDKYKTREGPGYEFRDPNYFVQYHWWGQLHFFYTDEVAYRYAYELNQMAIKGNSVATIAAVFVPLAAIIYLDANRASMIANDVNYYAGLPGNGVELSIKNWGTIECKARN